MTQLQHIYIFALILLWSCAPDAAHDNPFDPFNNSNIKYKIRGKVFTYYAPHAAIKGAEIKILPAGNFTHTNDQGSFELELDEPGEYSIIAAKELYQTDSAQIVVDKDSNEININFFLNGVPEIKNILIYSEFIDQWWPGSVTRMIADMNVSDSDGIADIDSAYLSIPTFSVLKQFVQKDAPDAYSSSLEQYELAGNTIYNIIGEEIFVVLKDKTGCERTYGPYYLHRIIDDTPVPLTPTGLSAAEQPVLFSWKNTEVVFSHVQVLSVYRVYPIGSVRIDFRDNLDPQLNQYEYNTTLEPGTYFWTIGLRDSLKNLSRSKEASFIIE